MANRDFDTSGTKSSPIVIQSEGSSFKAGIILDDTNYDLWSQIMEMHIAEKEKLSFIRGNSQPPTKEDDLYEKWYVDSQKVKGWLLMSMSPEIMKWYIHLPIARDIWKALYKASSDGANELQNGVAERKNRYLLEVFRASLIEAHLPLSYWGETLILAAYLINRVPSRTIDYQTPFQALVDAIVAPVLSNLPPYVFGCVAFVHLHKHQGNKLSPQALRCVFLGYAAHEKGYRCYHPPTHKMFITLDVVFHEDLMYFSTNSELQGEHQKEIQTLDYDDELVENVDVHISEDTQIYEDAGNLDISEDELSEPVNQVGKLVEESSHEHAETEVVAPSQSESDTPHATDTPHHALVHDALEPHRKLPQRLTRGNDPKEREALQGHLPREFKMKDLGPLKYFLGIEVSRSNKGIFLSQRKYALDLLRETSILACQPVDTLVEEGLKLRIESNQVPVDKGRYQRLVGRLMYLAHTRPDLAYALSIVSQ
ncbi:hypothetical protein RJ640_024706 [Escallonia rubra]|uniref:Reverse transcriptase Ty1/copia-type domain-containing protein n=1 Tax=Escallonia rubra TaxID=112253 RepID=A0AA88R5N8_9ASTE|nr:hypothetical protein RJ640_024706 [Escallonia rubra]